MLAIEGGSKIMYAAWLWGVPITSLRNHLNGVTLTKCRRKLGVFESVEEITLVDYIKQMQRIRHPITLI